MAIGIGIELGPSTIRAVVLERAGEQVALVSANEISCEAANPEAFTRALLQVRHTLRLNHPIVLGLPGASAILTTVSPLVVNARRAELAVQFELQQQLPFEMAQAVWHYQWLSVRNGQASGRARVTAPTHMFSHAAVAAVRRAMLEQRLASCRRAGVTVQAVTITSLASLNACLAEEAGRAGQPMVVLHLLSEQAAEWIVRTADALHVVPVFSPSIEALWDELAAALQNLRAEHPQLAGPVRLLQAPLPDADLSARCAERFGLSVEPMHDSRFLRGAGPLEHPERYVTAAGLALQAVGLAPLPLNLLAGSQRQQQARVATRVSNTASAFCLTAALALGLSGMIEVRHRRLLILQSLEARERLYQSLRPEVRALLQRQQHLQQRIQQLERLADSVPLLAHALGQIATALPDDVWLAKAECSKSGLIEGALDGRAKSFQEVTKFLERLKSVAGMTTVKPLSTNVTPDPTTGKEVVAFVVEVQRPLAAP